MRLMTLVRTMTFVLVASTGSAWSQISNPVADFPGTVSNQNVPGLYMARRPFVGEFRFDPLPSPLDTSTVTFTVVVFEPKSVFPENDVWTLRVLGDAERVRILGDSVFHWTGPHELGDRFTGSIQVVPLRAALEGFTLIVEGANHGGLRIEWYLDYSGELQFLGKGEDNAIARFGNDGPTFFTRDSVHLEHVPRNPENIFSYMIDVVPPFRIGDTSTVRYSLTTHRNLPQGVHTHFRLRHFQLIGPPPVISGPISAGQKIVVEMQVVPLSVANVHGVDYALTPAEGGSPNPMRIDAIFRDDGYLWLVGNGSLDGLSDEYRAKNLPVSKDPVSSLYYIKPDGSYRRAGQPPAPVKTE